jgi:hypothetical protein
MELMNTTTTKKKTVLINLEYMRPTPEPKRRSRKRSNSILDDGGSDESDTSDTYNEEDTDTDTETETETGTGTEIDTERKTNHINSSYTTNNGNNNKYQPQDSDYAVDSDEDLLGSVLDEPTFPLDVNAILSAMSKNENATIANSTFKEIEDRRLEILSSLDLPLEKYEEFARKLQMYRVIERPQDLRHGQLLRWIPLKSLSQKPYLTLGGTIFNIKQNIDDGLHQVTIRTVKGFVYQIKFELNVMFQRLSKEELMILRAVEYVSDVKL